MSKKIHERYSSITTKTPLPMGHVKSDGCDVKVRFDLVKSVEQQSAGFNILGGLWWIRGMDISTICVVRRYS